MKPYLSLFAAITAFFVCLPAQAQFDFGKIIKNEGRQILREVENRIVEEFKNEVLPIERTRPPVQTLPYHPIENEVPVRETPVSPPKKDGNSPSSSKVSSRKKAPKLPQVESGDIITLEGKGFGKEPGAIFVKIESLVLYTELVDWQDNLAEAVLPTLPMANNVKATVFVMKANEEIAEQLEIELTPPTEIDDEEAEEIEGAEAEQELPQVYTGQEVTLEGDLGEKKGKVELTIGTLKLEAKIIEWNKSETTIQLPNMKLDGSHQATLSVSKADGKKAEELDVLFSAAEDE